MSGLACHHRTWTTHTVGLRRALNAIITLEQHMRSNKVRIWHARIALAKHIKSDYVGHDMPSWPFDRTHGWASSSMS